MTTINNLTKDDSREFQVGDLVVLSPFSGDFAKKNDALYDLFAFENDLETLAVLSDRKGGEVRSSIEHLRHVTREEFKAGHRIDEQIKCWSCDECMTKNEYSSNDGFCIYCGNEVEAERHG